MRSPGEMRQGTAASAAARPADSPTDSANGRQVGRQAARQAGRQAGGQAGAQAGGQASRQAGRQAGLAAEGSPPARSPHDAADAGAHFDRFGNSAGQSIVKFAHMSQSMSEAPLA